MANRITQYQSKAEVRPLAGSFKERTTPDKWLGVEYLPFGNVFAKAAALSVLAVTTALAFVPLTTTTPVTPSVASWHPAIEQPRFAKAPTQYLASGYAAPDRQPQPRVDSWFQPASEPVRAVRTQYLAPSYFGPERQPQPRLDSWYQPASEPVRLPDRHVQALGTSELQLTPAQQPERVSADKWQPLTNQPQFDKKRTQYTYEWTAYDPQPFPDRVYADRWWQLGNQPQFDQRHNQYLYPSYFGPDRQPQPRVDSWWQQASEPVRLPDRRVQAQGLSVLGVPPAEDVEEVTPDRWQPLPNQPQFDLKRNQYLYPSLFAPDRQPQPRVDSWFQPASEPVRLRDSRIQRLGASELDLTPAQDTERTSADKWHPLGNQPLFDVRRTQYTFECSFFNPQPFPSPIFADKWWQQASEPVRLPDRRIQAQGAGELARTPAQDVERSTPDKWHPAIEQPLARRFNRAYLVELAGTPFTPQVAPVVSIASWFQQASEPVRRAPSRLHLFEFAVSGNGAAERVSPDKWHPLSNQPLFARARNQYLYPGYFAPERQPTVALDWFIQTSEPVRRARPPLPVDGGFIAILEHVTVDKWFQLPNQPRFDIRRAQYLYPSFFAPERQPDVRVSSWWQLGNQPLFDVRRAQYLYPSYFAPDRQPDVSIDAWWQLGNQPLFDVARQQWFYQTFAKPDAQPLLLPGAVSVNVQGNSIILALDSQRIDLAILLQHIDVVLTAFHADTAPTAGTVTVTISPRNG